MRHLSLCQCTVSHVYFLTLGYEADSYCRTCGVCAWYPSTTAQVSRRKPVSPSFWYVGPTTLHPQYCIYTDAILVAMLPGCVPTYRRRQSPFRLRMYQSTTRSHDTVDKPTVRTRVLQHEHRSVVHILLIHYIGVSIVSRYCSLVRVDPVSYTLLVQVLLASLLPHIGAASGLLAICVQCPSAA